MKSYHWIGAVVVIVLAYYAGTKGFLNKIKSTVTSATGT